MAKQFRALNALPPTCLGFLGRHDMHRNDPASVVSLRVAKASQGGIIMSQYCIQQDICSFGKPAIGQEHLMQIYPPLSHFDHLVIKHKTTVLAPPLISVSTSTDPLIYRSVHQRVILVLFYIKHLCLYYRYLESKNPSFKFEILILDSCNGQVSDKKYIYSRTRSYCVNKSFMIIYQHALRNWYNATFEQITRKKINLRHLPILKFMEQGQAYFLNNGGIDNQKPVYTWVVVHGVLHNKLFLLLKFKAKGSARLFVQGILKGEVSLHH